MFEDKIYLERKEKEGKMASTLREHLGEFTTLRWIRNQGEAWGEGTVKLEKIWEEGGSCMCWRMWKILKKDKQP